MSKLKSLFFAAIVFVTLLIIIPIRSGASTMGYAWPHSGGHYPYVIVENHNPHYPITTAVARWGVIMHMGKCADHPHAGCIQVVDVHWGQNGISGLTPTGYWPGKNGATGTIVNAKVQLNYGYAYKGYSYRLQAAMHELGHAIGLDHDAGGVMNYSIAGDRLTPTSYERSELRSLYQIR